MWRLEGVMREMGREGEGKRGGREGGKGWETFQYQFPQ